MNIYTATSARENLYKLISDVNSSHDPVTITSKKGAAILVAEEDWAAIQETLYLLSIPKMRKSIQQGMKEPLKSCDKELDW